MLLSFGCLFLSSSFNFSTSFAGSGGSASSFAGCGGSACDMSPGIDHEIEENMLFYSLYHHYPVWKLPDLQAAKDSVETQSCHTRCQQVLTH